MTWPNKIKNKDIGLKVLDAFVQRRWREGANDTVVNPLRFHLRGRGETRILNL